jgi:prevent-host-death family protein
MIENLNLEQKKIDLGTAKAHLEELVDEVLTKRSPKVITKDDKPAVVLVNAEVYQAILDFLEEIEEADDNRVADEMAARVESGEVEIEDWGKLKKEWNDVQG